MRLLALLLAGFAAAPLRAVEVAPVRVVAPVNAAMMGASAVGADMRTRLGPLTTPGLSGLTPNPILTQMAPPALVPSVIPTAPEPALTPQAGDFSASVMVPQAVSLAAPVAGAAVLPQTAEPSLKAVETLRGFVAQMDSSRVSGRDLANSLSDRFFDQSAQRSPVAVDAAEVPASQATTPRLPQGVSRVAVGTVLSAADVDRLLPDPRQSHNPYVREYLEQLVGGLKNSVSQMAPYQIYTYYDRRGGRMTGIDLSANPAIVDQIPDLHPHEVRLIKKLMLVNSDIRVLVREDGKTPDLVIGDQVVEMKTFLGEQMTLEQLINKANDQVLEHGQNHGLGHGAAAVDLAKEQQVPVERVHQLLNSWQASRSNVVLDRVIFFGGDEMKVFARQADGSYQSTQQKVSARTAAQDRPVLPHERAAAQSLLRASRPAPSTPEHAAKVLPDGGRDISPKISDPLRVKAILKLVADIKAGRPLPFPAHDGGVFSNYEGGLPRQADGYYREYTFTAPAGADATVTINGKTYSPNHKYPGDRGSERIMIGGGTEIWYTPDHYATFIRLTVLP